MQNAIQRHGLDAYKALLNRNLKCKEQYIVPIAFHVIYDSQGRGNVTDVMLEEQIRVLNSKCFLIFIFLTWIANSSRPLTEYFFFFNRGFLRHAISL